MITATEFSESYEKTKTRKRVEQQMNKYLNYVLPDEQEQDKSQKYIQQVTEGVRNPKEDIKGYIAYLNERMTGSSVNNYVNTILYWMNINEITFTKWETKQIKRIYPENETITEEEEIDKETLKLMLETLKKPEHKLMFLIMESAGTRITETGEIRIENIHQNETPMRITLNGNTTKSKRSRNIMVTKECATMIKEFIGNRKEGRLFRPNIARNLYQLWRTKIQNLGKYQIVNGKKRSTFHPHMLRKWFLSQFALNSNKEIGEMLAGHEGYLTKQYRRYSIKECAKYYLKAEKSLTIYDNTPTIQINKIESAYYEA